MRVPPVHRLTLPTRRSAMVAVLLLTIDPADAQQIQFGFGGPAEAELTAPQVDLVSGTTSARLEQARALAADGNWDEAVDTFRELAVAETDRVVALDDGRYVGLRTYCHMQTARLPAEALAAYRRRVDALAERWYRDGLAERDEGLLRRVVDELFCSSWGDDALLALGDLALERADYAAARCAWEQISPLTRDPTGLPMWLALRDIDLNAHWPEVVRRWFDRSNPPEWLAYPDTSLDLAEVRARLVLASIRAGESHRATLELEVIRRLHPDAVGRLGGQQGPYVTALERLLTSASDWPEEPRGAGWPTFAGSPTRSPAAPQIGPVTGPAWAEPVRFTPTKFTRISAGIVHGGPFGGGSVEDNPQVAVRESQRPLSCFPVVVDDAIVFGDATGIRAVDLATGQPAITTNGLLYHNDSLDQSTTSSWFGDDVMDLAPRRRGRDVRGIILAARPAGGDAIAHGVPRFTLSAADGIVYGRVGPLATTHLESRVSSSGERLVGLDLKRDGLLTFRARPEDATWSFDGVPVGDGRRVYIAMRHSDVSPHAYVACFDAATGNQLWRTSIGAADTPAAGRGDEVTHNLLTLAGDRIYFNSNLGLVAALDAVDGRICWLRRYDRLAGKSFIPGLPGPLCFDRDPSPCLYHEGLVIVAPSDTPTVFALAADTGQTIWANRELADTLHLLGVHQRNLILSGNRLWAVDVRSGKVRFIWPESEHVGIRGMGRGVVAGDEVFWPTRNKIYAIHAVTGGRTRPPIDLGPVSDCGANLAAGQGRLIVAGVDTLMAFGAALPQPPRRTNDPEPIAEAN